MGFEEALFTPKKPIDPRSNRGGPVLLFFGRTFGQSVIRSISNPTTGCPRPKFTMTCG